MNLQHDFNKGARICHKCGARKDGVAPSGYDFSTHPAWLETCDELEPAWGTNIPPVLRQIQGYTKSHIIVDAMHCIHLGVLLIACGNRLRSLFGYNHCGVFAGKLKVRARLFLNAAYARLVDFAKREGHHHSQTRFSLSCVGIPKGWPELLAKAANAKVVTHWLASEFAACANASPSELALFQGLVRVLHIIHAGTSA